MLWPAPIWPTIMPGDTHPADARLSVRHGGVPARHKKGKLATMYRAVTELLPDKSMEGNLAVVI